MKFNTIAAAVLAATSIMALPAAASTVNLIENGSFEITPAFNTSKSWRVFQGSTVDGWTVRSGTGVEIQNETVISTPFGDNYVELDSDKRNGGDSTAATTNSSIGQALNNVLSAGTYRLSFWYAPRTNNDEENTIRYELAGATATDPVFSRTVSGPSAEFPRRTWKEVQYTFSLDPANDNPYYLIFTAEGDDTSLGGFIDNVSLHAVPVPASGLLLVAGLGGLAALRRRKRM